MPEAEASARPAVVLSVEHAGKRLPAAYRRHFASPEATAALDSHRGWDAGAQDLAHSLAAHLGAPLHILPWSRLLVDTNRSLGHPRLFSAWSRALPAAARKHLVERYYQPHRAGIAAAVEAAIARTGRVIHLGIHSFTPIWNGRVRTTDLGLLYDPARRRERDLCAALLRQVRSQRRDLRIHRNRPYRGTSDGLTTTLRQRFAAATYLGIELEINQRFPLGPPAAWQALIADLTKAIAKALGEDVDPMFHSTEKPKA